MNVRRIAQRLHRWLGLVSGLVVLIVSLTGALYAFQEEIKGITEASFRSVEAGNTDFLPPSALEKICRDTLPDYPLHSLAYGKRDQSVEAIFYQAEPLIYHALYIDPYTGKTLKGKDLTRDFFHIVLQGHYYLWLPPGIGKPVVASATLVFVVLILLGLFLWWPKNKKVRKQRTWFRWKKSTGWRRKNYDLHNIVGFYVLSIALIFGITGLIWGFSWFGNAVYGMAGGEKSTEYRAPQSISDSAVKMEAPALDQAWNKTRKRYTPGAIIDVHVPVTDKDAIFVLVREDHSTHWKSEYLYFDQYSLKELSSDHHIWGKMQEATVADKLIRMNYDIHVGAILSFPGKVLAFLVSLLCASLPVSGFLVWLGRRNKKPATRK